MESIKKQSDKSMRPLSPHLGIYKPQISSTLSILHRASGVVNFLGLFIFVWWIVGLTFLPQSLSDSCIWGFFNTTLGYLILVLWSFSLFFHFCTGIRHLCWEAGFGFSVKAMEWSGWIAIVMSLTFTAITWFIIYMGA